MIRRLLIGALLTLLPLNAASDPEALSPMELLLFKIGYTSLIEDFEREKNTTAFNTKRIEELEKNFRLLVNFMEMTKKELVQSGELTPEAASRYGIYDSTAMKKELTEILGRFRQNMETEQKDELLRLRREVAGLKTQLAAVVKGEASSAIVQPAPKAAQTTTFANPDQRYTPKGESLNIRSAPSVSGAAVGLLQRGESVRFEHCDPFGWCKLDGVEGYVARYLLIPVDPGQ